MALLGKWIWHLETEKGGFWKEILDSKYGGWRILQDQRSNAKDSNLKGVGGGGWRNGIEPLRCCEWRVGNGKDILFWKDVWVGNEDLKSKFPRLYSLCGNKEGNLESCGEWVNDSWEWKLVWRIGLFDWENSQEAQLLQEVHEKAPVLSIEDSWVWKVGKDSGFSVKSAYAKLRGPYEGDSLFVSLWKSYVLPSAQFTAWRVLFNSVATKVNLERRGVSVDSNLCSFCRMEVESTNHLFFECRIVGLVWKQCFTWLEIMSVDHVDLISHFLQ